MLPFSSFLFLSLLVRTFRMDSLSLQARLAILKETAGLSTCKQANKKEITSATRNLYENEAKSWEKFKLDFGNQDLLIDLESLKLYFEWFASSHRGKLDEKPNINTLVWRVGRFLCMCKNKYKVMILKQEEEILISVSSSLLMQELN
jgi:hypothetical protein